MTSTRKILIIVTKVPLTVTSFPFRGQNVVYVIPARKAWRVWRFSRQEAFFIFLILAAAFLPFWKYVAVFRRVCDERYSFRAEESVVRQVHP